ncbi:MAG: CCA tRNA nucleotidyltransferase [Phycisphaerae bacterium]|nr:CCA tRNA nucleotidyltransferase [Phycisphaerae bacterium]
MTAPHQPERDRGQSPGDPKVAADRVVRLLQAAGHTTYFAGGCVRDLVMGLVPKDYDVATSATPDQVCALFHRTQRVGAQFGVVLVRMKGWSIEVATFRTDLDYADGRHPVAVAFSTPEQDAQRRDFTINGMFHDPIGGQFIDYVGGRSDIAARLIRAIGEPDRRFSEDHLRLLRAIRFASRLRFEIEPETWDAIGRHAGEIRRISPERIRMELDTILTNEHRADAAGLINRSGLLGHLWAGAESLSPTFDSAIRRLAALPSTSGFELSMAALLGDMSTDAAVEALEALRCSNHTIATVRWLHAHQHDADDPTRLTLADIKRLRAHAMFPALIDLWTARQSLTDFPTSGVLDVQQRAAAIQADAVAPPALVTGDDLKDMGLTPGPAFKRILDALYELQLNEQIVARDVALAEARRLMEAMR